MADSSFDSSSDANDIVNFGLSLPVASTIPADKSYESFLLSYTSSNGPNTKSKRESIIELDDDSSVSTGIQTDHRKQGGKLPLPKLKDDRKYSVQSNSSDDETMLSFPITKRHPSDGTDDLISRHRPAYQTKLDDVALEEECTYNLPSSPLSSSDDENFRSNSSDIYKAKTAPDKVHTFSYADAASDDDDDDSLAAIKSKLSVAAHGKPYTSLSQSSSAVIKNNNKSTASKAASSSSVSNRLACADRTNVLVPEKQLRQQKMKEERLRLRAEKEAAKLERERQRNDKKIAILAEKESKKRYREVCQQTSGKLAKKEIAVLLQKDLLVAYTVVGDLEKMGYYVQEYPSALQCNAVQWIRKNALQGGAQLAVQNLHGSQSGYQHLPVLTIVVDNAPAFLKLLERSADDDEDDYPALEEWLKGIEYGWRAAWKVTDSSGGNHTVQPQQQRPRLILLLVRIPEGLDKLWVQYRKDGSGRTGTSAQPPPTAEELHDAITWILIQFQIECVHCKSINDVSANLCKITRLLADSPYRQAVTEFACIKKIKGNMDDATPQDRATDCWIRQLQQIPNISHARALHLASYYPTALSLWTAYQNNVLTTDEKRSLVANCFDATKSFTKLSNQLYTIMTSQDPNEMLN
jgi:hypothetical protein